MQRAIDSVYQAIGRNTLIKETVGVLENERYHFEQILSDLKEIFTQDRWKEAEDVKQTVRYTGDSFRQTTERVLQEASRKVEQLEEKLSIYAGSATFKSKREETSERTGYSRSSLRSERRRALAEAAAAKE